METRRSKRKDAENPASGDAPLKRARIPTRSSRSQQELKKDTSLEAPTSNSQQAEPRGKVNSRGADTSAQPNAADGSGAGGSGIDSHPPASSVQPPVDPAFSQEKDSMERQGRQQRVNRNENVEAPSTAAEEDKEFSAEVFGRNFSSASSALQGLLRKLGAGFEDILPMGGLSGARVKGIIAGLRQVEDEPQQLTALTDLCELLSISTEDTLTAFPVETVVPLLVQLLNMEHNPDIMLLAARALTFMADVLPSSCTVIVRHGAVPAFCARLLTIEYIDLAEQSLQALEKLSHDHSHALLQSGGLLAVLSYLDFFPTGVQRVAVATAANMCRGLSPENAESVKDAVPILTGLLQYPDAKVVDNACVALSSIAEAFATKSDLLELLSTQGLINQALQLISISESGSMTSQLSLTTYYGLIKLLTTCSSGSPPVAHKLLQGGLIDILKALLANSALLSNTGSASSSVLRSTDQLHEVIGLAYELLPPVPEPAAAILEDAPTTAGGWTDVVQSNSAKCKFYNDNPEIVLKFSSDLLPLLLQVYGSTVMPQVRHKGLQTISKILLFATPDMLLTSLQDLAISSFVASLLSSKDTATVACALVMAEVLMERLPDIFTTYFLKEGVVHALDQLAASCAPSSAGTSGKTRVTRGAARVTKLQGKEDTARGEASVAASLRQPGSTGLKEALAARAKRFKATYYSEAAGKLTLETDSLKLLRKLCKNLAKDPANLQQLFEVISNGSVSMFELLNSGAVKQLITYLTGEDLHKQEAGREEAILQRLKSFVEIALPPGSGCSPPLVGLVRRLQSALASVETFPVLCSRVACNTSPSRSLTRNSAGAASYSGSSLSSGLVALTQPFKLRLCRHPNDKTLKEYSPNIVLIEPLATMAAIEEFLCPRVYKLGAATDTGRPRVTALEPAACGSSVPSALSHPQGSAPMPVKGSASQDAKGKSSAAQRPGTGSRAQPIPDDNSNRRITRAQAARACVEAQSAAEESYSQTPASHSVATGDDDDFIMQAAEEVDDDEHDEDMDDPSREPDDMFEEEDDFEEEEEEEEEMGLGSMQVHDLHVETDNAPAVTTDAPPDLTSPAPGMGLYARAAANKPAGTAADGINCTGAPPKLLFFMGDTQLSSTTTVFQAIQQLYLSGANSREEGEEPEEEGPQPRRGRRLWDDIYTLHYTLADAGSIVSAANQKAAASGSSAMQVDSEGTSRWAQSPLYELLSTSLPEDLIAAESCREVLHLLQVLEVVNRLGARLCMCLDVFSPENNLTVLHGRVAREDFISSKLGSKLAQQLKDVLSICGGGLPGWCKQLGFSCKFLFPFEIRRRYFYCTAFGLGRALQHMQQLHNVEAGAANMVDREGRELRLARLQRQKVRVSRKRILESAVKVMELYAKHRAVLELEYFGEVGTGLGPTLEFYTLLSHDLQQKSLGMWRTEVPNATLASEQGEAPDPNSDLVYAPKGLFPAPLPESQRGSSKVIDYFRLLGRTMAKSLQDSRLLDLPLSHTFYKAALGRQVDMYDIRTFDPALGSSLEKLYAALRSYQAQGSKGELLIDGCRIEDLCMTFVLPGYPQYVLEPSGEHVVVDAKNLEEYIQAVVNASLGEGVRAQLDAYREGFNEVFPLRTLDCFYEDEIECMLCGSGEKWTVQSLTESIKFDHGYTAQSVPARHFMETLSDLDVVDQRHFLRFVTGCPRLPAGGIAALQPRLTVVRKHPSAGDSSTPGSTPTGSFKDGVHGTTLADGDLPSVMTCANYIKLPPYSTKHVMRDRLLYAIREGQGSFDLS